MIAALKVLAPFALFPLVLGLCLAMGPKRPAPLSHVAERFGNVDWSALPPLREAMMRDGTALAYRVYGHAPLPAARPASDAGAPGGLARGTGTREIGAREIGAREIGSGEGPVLLALHGSGGAGAALHPLAQALWESGAVSAVIVPDIRGHGGSGKRGDVSYVDQPLHDLDDLLDLLVPGQQVDVVGFSMGGGLALKFAAARPDRTNRVTALSPYLSHDAPPMAASTALTPATPWAVPAVPRIAALTILNAIGLTALNHLPVVALATRAEDADTVVRAYTFRAIRSLNPSDWRADTERLAPRLRVVVGDRDELHSAPAYRDALAGIGSEAPALHILPGVDHMGLTLAPEAIAAVTALVAPTIGGAK